jgi:hypothetical protein
MASLSAHLRQPADHGRLPFHPECPVCRDRLTGELSSNALVGRRTQAVLAAGVLAVSAAAPSAVLAAEPDTEQEGAEVVDPAAPQTPLSAPDVDPGGDSTELPVEVSPIPEPGSITAPDNDDAGPVEQEAASDDDAALDESLTPGEQPAAPLPDVVPPPAEVAPALAPAAAEVPAPAAATPPTQPEPAAPPARKEKRDKPGRKSTSRAKSAGGVAAPSTAAPVAAAPSYSSTPASTVPATLNVAQPAPHASSARDRAKQGDRTHVVAPGESLWSIADDLLGDDASVARVAREVNRLWELNARRIGTGDPSLVRVGTTLML